MTSEKLRRDAASDLWRLARRQHGVVSRAQLLELGLGEAAIEHRLARGRLHRLWRGVYAVGRPETTRKGRWMAAVLSCGPMALLSHRSAAGLWGLLRPGQEDLGRGGEIDVMVPEGICRNRSGVRVRRRSGLQAADRREVDGIPVTDLVSTLVDLASCAPDWEVEGAINAADRLDLVDPRHFARRLRHRRAAAASPGCAGCSVASRLLTRGSSVAFWQSCAKQDCIGPKPK
jgi:predicted transcriptional regulator of viral defense system